MSNAAFRLRWGACALLLAALGAVLTVLPSRGAAEESAKPEAKAEVYRTWPFDSAEAKRRQEETAKRLGIPVERSLDLGNGVKLDLVLIPAGRFIMGTEEPELVDEERFVTQMWIGRVALAISGGVLLALAAFVIVRAVREKHRPQVSLARLVVLALIAGAGLLGGLHWRYSERGLSEAKDQYSAALVLFQDAKDSDKPAHEVTLTKPFYIGKCEVTQEQFQQIVGRNPGWIQGRDLPVQRVSWDEAQGFCRTLSEKMGLVARLPTEAEWEYACRAGTRTVYYTGDSEADLDRAAWYENTSKWTLYPVAQKAPNAWGVCDMHGNVWEWCADWYEIYKAEMVVDPPGPPEGQVRVIRGGSWYSTAWACRSAYHVRDDPGDDFDNLFDGFRVVVAIPMTP